MILAVVLVLFLGMNLPADLTSRKIQCVYVDIGGVGGERVRRSGQVRTGLSAGGRWIRTIGTPPNFFGRPSIPAQFTFRNINRLPRDRDRWFESISLQQRVIQTGS